MTFSLRLLAVLILTGCSATPAQTLHGDDPRTRTARSGTRLVAVEVTDVQGDARRFVHFRDRETSQPCQLVPIDAELGTYACLPEAVARIAYLDPNCEGDPLPNVVESDDRWVRLGEGFAPDVVRLGAPLDDVEVYTHGGHRGCHPATEVWVQRGTTFRTAEQREATTFVTGTYEVDASLDRIDRTSFKGSDGSTLLVSLFDRLANTTCRPGEAPDGAGPRCIPAIDRLFVGPELEDLFLPGCDQPVVASYSAPAVGFRTDDPDEVIYRFVRPERDVDVARRDPMSGACVPVVDLQLGRRSLFEVHPYPASAWPIVRLERHGAPDATVDVAWSVEGAALAASPSPNPEAHFTSTTLGASCAPGWVDGELRCVPVTPWVSGVERGAFENSGCTRRALALSAGSTPPTIAAFESAPATATQAGLRSWGVHFVDPTPVDGWILRWNGDCSRAVGVSVFRLGDEAGADDLPRLVSRDLTLE